MGTGQPGSRKFELKEQESSIAEKKPENLYVMTRILFISEEMRDNEGEKGKGKGKGTKKSGSERKKMKMRIGIRVMVAAMTIIMLVVMALAMALVGNATANPANDVDTCWTNNIRVGGTCNATSPDNDNYTFTLSVKGTEAAEGPEVTVYDNAATTNNGSAGYDFASCTRNVAIPKFATVALPAVSVLFLFLLLFLHFNHRGRDFKGV